MHRLMSALSFLSVSNDYSIMPPLFDFQVDIEIKSYTRTSHIIHSLKLTIVF